MNAAAIKFILVVLILAGSNWSSYRSGIRTENADRRAEVAELVREQTQRLADIDKKHRTALAEELQRRLDDQAKHQADMAALDAKFTKEMNDAKRKSDADVAAVRAGAVRVRDRFTCPSGSAASTSGAADQAGGTAGMGDGGTGRGFGPEDAAAVIAAADEGDRWAAQLRACQQIVRRDRAGALGVPKP